MNSVLIMLASKLSDLITKTSEEYVSAKMSEAKATNDFNKALPIYSELINKLLNDKQEAITVASQYRAELDKTFLPDTDIKYLETTFSKLIKLFEKFDSKESPTFTSEIVEQINGLVNTETLKSMQLLGFDFKSAIGQPITLGVEKLIKNKFDLLVSDSTSPNGSSEKHIPDTYVYHANIYKETDQGGTIEYILRLPAYNNFQIKSPTPGELESRAINSLAFFLFQNGWTISPSDFSDNSVVDKKAFTHTLITIDMNYARSNYGVPENNDMICLLYTS
ncbi:hypothetical protein GBO83_07860, partial [Pediococcus acidilactici]